MHNKHLCRLLAGASIVTVIAGSPALAAVEDFTNLSLEELMTVEVTTAAKTPQTLMHTAAAAFVITKEDIRRSGATNIPQLLRMVPGIDVAQVNASTYAISARGFNGVYANKLLVLIDGRSVYTPLFSGVQWDLQDTMLEDIDHIEIVRGPGGTLWGANAFNGVINVITKNAFETLGGTAVAYGGNLQSAGALRYGAQIEPNSAYRIWGKYDHHEEDAPTIGIPVNDRFDFGRGGFRYDAKPTSDMTVMLEGGATRGDENQLFKRLQPAFPFITVSPSLTPISAGHLLGRVTKRTAADQEWQFQSYVDWTDRGMAIIGEQRLTADMEIQHSSHPFDGHHLVWGLGYRATTDWTHGSFDISLVPSKDLEHLANFFVQDEVTLVPNTLSVIAGSKFEYTSWGGFDVQPNIRAIWNPSAEQALWASVSRAVRTPSRAERNLNFNYTVLMAPVVPFRTLVTVLGNPGLVSEKVVAFETGYRWQPSQRVNLDLAGFYNIYTDLTTVDPGVPRLLGGLLNLPVQFHNSAEGNAYGAELAAGWQPLDWLSLRSAYTYQLTQLSRLAPGVSDTTSVAYQNSIPRHKAYARASFNITPALALDLQARYVGRLNLSAANTALLMLPNVNSYWALDARIGWHVTERLLVELIGQNLNRSKHIEFQDFGPTRSATAAIPRSALARVTAQF